MCARARVCERESDLHNAQRLIRAMIILRPHWTFFFHLIIVRCRCRRCHRRLSLSPSKRTCMLCIELPQEQYACTHTAPEQCWIFRLTFQTILNGAGWQYEISLQEAIDSLPPIDDYFVGDWLFCCWRSAVAHVICGMWQIVQNQTRIATKISYDISIALIYSGRGHTHTVHTPHTATPLTVHRSTYRLQTLEIFIDKMLYRNETIKLPHVVMLPYRNWR